MSCEREPSAARLAAPSFVHLRRLTDDTGLLEHALGRIPRRKEGYTADDNARALWTVTEWLSSPSGDDVPSEELSRLADVYLAYLLWSQDDDGWIHNNIAYDRSPEPEERSHDCQGRSFWACADAWVRLSLPVRETARAIVERAMPTLRSIDSHRGQAFAMAACAHLLEAGGRGDIDLPGDVRGELAYHLDRFEGILTRAFETFDDGSKWRWFEPAMTYGNGVLPWAMLRAYRYTRCSETMRAGLASLGFLLGRMTADEGWLRPIGNESWCTKEGSGYWDQQPLETFKLALALEEAALVVPTAAPDSRAVLVGSFAATAMREGVPPLVGTGGDDGDRRLRHIAHPHELSPERYRALRDLCREWYFGFNDLGAPLVDPSDGSCCDGLTRYGPNVNCGAESTLSYLMTAALCRRGE
ncbi:hypothetical protein [Cohnella sp. GCM10027633]|uniref:hypothetical protein n=1 Tax=unclassified Cohnella TaxID=2636738 RepID=UPI003644BFD3